jgi:thymidylate synthase
LTTDAVNAATAQWRLDMRNLRELVETKISTLEAIVTANKERGEADFQHLRELNSDKFGSISLQFAERDVRTTQASVATDSALKAALQAAKELVGAQGEASAAAAVKSETSFTKQIDQIATIIQTLEKSVDGRLNELKERIDRGEGSSSGVSTALANQRSANSLNVTVISVVLLAAGFIITLLVFLQ